MLKQTRISCEAWAVQATKLPTPSLPPISAAACPLQALPHVRYIPLPALMCPVKVLPCKVFASAQARMAMLLGTGDLNGKIMVLTQGGPGRGSGENAESGRGARNAQGFAAR